LSHEINQLQLGDRNMVAWKAQGDPPSGSDFGMSRESGAGRIAGTALLAEHHVDV